MVSEPNNVNIEELIAKTHVTAFIDILGWSAITQANINDIFRKVVIAKEEGMKPSLMTMRSNVWMTMRIDFA